MLECLDAWNAWMLGMPGCLEDCLKAWRLGGLAAWPGSLTRSTLGEVGGFTLMPGRGRAPGTSLEYKHLEGT